MTMKRKRLTAEEKIEIIGFHIKKAQVSGTCEEYDIHPNQFNKWIKLLLEAGANTLNGKGRINAKAQFNRQAILEEEIARKDKIIAELAGEVISLKKFNGETLIRSGSPLRR